MRRLINTALRESEKAEIKDKDSEESENRVSEKAEVYIIKVTEKIRKQDADKSVKNKFFIRKIRTANKKKFIISLKDASSLFTLFFSKSRDSEKMKKITII